MLTLLFIWWKFFEVMPARPVIVGASKPICMRRPFEKWNSHSLPSGTRQGKKEIQSQPYGGFNPLSAQTAVVRLASSTSNNSKFTAQSDWRYGGWLNYRRTSSYCTSKRKIVRRLKPCCSISMWPCLAAVCLQIEIVVGYKWQVKKNLWTVRRTVDPARSNRRAARLPLLKWFSRRWKYLKTQIINVLFRI